ncbi:MULTISPECIES: hypothetical protein [Moorena]|uniref:hypothetical protein n=1 Tax=Moorena TaxID=1155738 RepID=UPI000314849F|nr:MULTISPECIES: hypothetical protein [Moorena]NEP34170.1 hypothetical protein [Moorena sp. SIO3B2]NEQ13031.1 hypothetical protein [Moorena sp. SIO3E2]NET67676.1 hypothetical protein [Moorena sp. SIO1G6]
MVDLDGLVSSLLFGGREQGIADLGIGNSGSPQQGKNLVYLTTDSLGALSVGELNSPRVAPLPTPYSRFPTP